LVENRTLVFLTLAILVWAILTSSLAAFFYLQNTTYTIQIAKNHQSLDKVSSTYDESMNKYNALQSEHSTIYGNYFFSSVNLTTLMDSLGRLIDNLRGNYTSLLMNQKDLNETFYMLKEDYETAYQEGNVTRGDFEELLNEHYELFNLLAMRELSIAVSEAVTLTVSICINCTDGTEEWYNETNAPAGYSLFQLTGNVTTIDDYDYNPLMRPGRIRLKSINGESEYTNYNLEEGYSEGHSWLWYYWDSNEQNWVLGPVGCDAWILEDGGIYKWSCEYWRWPPQ